MLQNVARHHNMSGLHSSETFFFNKINPLKKYKISEFISEDGCVALFRRKNLFYELIEFIELK